MISDADVEKLRNMRAQGRTVLSLYLPGRHAAVGLPACLHCRVPRDSADLAALLVRPACRTDTG